ncbi:D-sorbose [Diaporthe amygdali]|uniref:D-sorbose n=1 Tax=Phomopsis amygdali TaxID=1214568 RepID=UPI0022FE0F53|nr:D-sorbose [Diaporthe amygdali]KAJ0117814.1 D-sorbose [Diaporthe amygdali]
MKHLVMVGACYLDTILSLQSTFSVPHYPEEDAKLRATKLKVRRGGNGGNSLEVLQQFIPLSSPPDLALHLVATLPDRHAAATAQVVSSFGPNSPVDLSHCLYRDDQIDAASTWIISSQATGTRTIVNHSSLDEMTTDEFVKIVEAFHGEDEANMWWHFEGRIPETTLQCIQHLRLSHPRSRISVEVEKPAREGLRELAAEADVVFYSKSWAEGEGYASAEACLTAESVRTPKAEKGHSSVVHGAPKGPPPSHSRRFESSTSRQSPV